MIQLGARLERMDADSAPRMAQQSLRFAHDRYEAGHASDLEELDAQRNLYAAALDNRVQLYKALGGWQPADAAPPPKP